MNQIYNILAIALGGAVGSVLRYLTGVWLGALGCTPVVSTLAVNVCGSFAIGVLMGCTEGRLALLAVTGLCGGFTTFSTFSAQSVDLLARGEWMSAALYIGASVVLCLLATIVGFAVVR